MNGELSDERDDAVVDLYAGVGGERDHCSGTLVAPNVVLTALHCVAIFNSLGSFSCGADGSLSTATPPDGSIGATEAPESIEVRVGVTPGADADAFGLRVFGARSSTICINDIALVVLDRELDSPVAPIRLERQTVRGEYATVVGYGFVETGALIQRHRRSGLRVLDVGRDAAGQPGSSTTAPRTLVVGQGPCYGDSGGPVFSEETGAVMGVYSIMSGSSCSSETIRNTYTKVAPFEALVREAFEFAGQEPILETLPSEGGAGGESGSPGSTDAGTGGSVDNGGTGGTGGTGGVTAGRSGANGDAGEEPIDPGSRSRQDPSCACNTFPQRLPAPAGIALFSLVVLAASRRRRRPPECV